MASDMIDLGLGVDLFAEEEEDPEILADPLNQLDLKVCSLPTPPSPSSQIAQPKCQKMHTAGHSGTPVEQMCSGTATAIITFLASWHPVTIAALPRPAAGTFEGLLRVSGPAGRGIAVVGCPAIACGAGGAAGGLVLNRPRRCPPSGRFTVRTGRL